MPRPILEKNRKQPSLQNASPQTASPTTRTSPQQHNITSQQQCNITSQHIEILKQLDQRYSELRNAEDQLQHYIQALQREEKLLRIALDQSTTSIVDQREMEQIRKDREAVARLEEVLMGEDSSGSSSDDNGDGEQLSAYDWEGDDNNTKIGAL